MITGKYVCPSGWTTEYYGYLMAEAEGHYRSQYTCVDVSLTMVRSSNATATLSFYPVELNCDALPCSPYDATKEITCAVCTK